jgi:Domain of unknown function (DUF1127)
MARATSTSMINCSVPQVGFAATGNRYPALMTRVGLILAVWKERNRLADLDARALNDLGLTRSDVAMETRRSLLDVPVARG